MEHKHEHDTINMAQTEFSKTLECGHKTSIPYAFKGIQKSAYYKVLWASRFPLIICNQRMFRHSKDDLEPISCMRQLSNGNPNV